MEKSFSDEFKIRNFRNKHFFSSSFDAYLPKKENFYHFVQNHKNFFDCLRIRHIKKVPPVWQKKKRNYREKNQCFWKSLRHNILPQKIRDIFQQKSDFFSLILEEKLFEFEKSSLKFKKSKTCVR